MDDRRIEDGLTLKYEKDGKPVKVVIPPSEIIRVRVGRGDTLLTTPTNNIETTEHIDTEGATVYTGGNFLSAFMGTNDTKYTVENMGGGKKQYRTLPVLDVFFTKEGELFDKTLTPEAYQFFLFLNERLVSRTSQYSPDTVVNAFQQFPYTEYMEKVGAKDKTSAKWQIKHIIAELLHTSATFVSGYTGYVKNEQGKPVKHENYITYIPSIIGAVKIPVKAGQTLTGDYLKDCIKQGKVYVKLNDDLAKMLVASPQIRLPNIIYKIDTRTYRHAINIICFLVNQENMNTGRPNEGRVKLDTLIKKCPYLPQLEDLKGQTNFRLGRNIIEPLLNNINALQDVYGCIETYELKDKDGKEVDYNEITSKDIGDIYFHFTLTERAMPRSREDLLGKQKHKDAFIKKLTTRKETSKEANK